MSSRPQSEWKGFQWKLRRIFDNLADFFDRGTTKPYPETADALRRLRQAMEAELTTVRNRRTPTYPHSKQLVPKQGRKRTLPTLPSGPSRKHYQRWLRLRIENDKLRSTLACHTAAKVEGNLISPEWIMRVFLSSPSANARGMANRFGTLWASTQTPLAECQLPRCGTPGLSFTNQWS